MAPMIVRGKYVFVVGAFFGLAAVVVVAIFVFGNWELGDEETGAPMLTTGFIDLDAVEKISKFRSCQGHTVVPQDESESRRNMKHYVVLKDAFVGKNVSIKAPFDGYVQGTYSNPENGLEGEIWIGVMGNPWAVSFEHIMLVKEFHRGERVKAGDVLGYVPDRGFDVVYAIGAEEVKNIDGWNSPFSALDSVFHHMSDQAFAAYQSHGVTSRETLMYSKEFRDARPCEYITGLNVQAGQLNDFNHMEDWIFLR